VKKQSQPIKNNQAASERFRMLFLSTSEENKKGKTGGVYQSWTSVCK